METVDKNIILPGGRRLGYREHGCLHGAPLFFFHGTPGSRLDWDLIGRDEVLSRLGIRLIAVDRPGMGLSDFQPGRRFLDWPADVAALADSLAISRFSVLGYSSGGAYALACAVKIPERIVHAGILNADGPYDLPDNVKEMEWATLQALLLACRSPALFQLSLRLIGWVGRFLPALFLAGFKGILDEPDRSFLNQEETSQALRRTFVESLKKGPLGAQYDMALMVSPWDFQPQDISVPVCMWYGEADKSTSPEMGYFLARTIPQNEAKFYSVEGHLSLFSQHAEEILSALAEGCLD